MTLTKFHLIDAIAQQNGFTRKKSTQTVETILEIPKSTITSGEDVMISGFGKFCVKEKQKRKDRNLDTCEDMLLGARRVMTFRSSGKLWDKVNGLMGNLI